MVIASAAWIAAGAAAALAAVGAGLVVVCGPTDNPRARGSHAAPTPTSGGLAIIAGAGIGLWLFAGLWGGGDKAGLSAVALCMLIAAGMGALGAVDDLLDLRARMKLSVQAVLALVFALAVARIDSLPLAALDLPLGAVAGTLGTILWLVVVVNTINFMDGSNGLAAGATAIALLALAAAGFGAGAPAVGGAALATAAAILGFLPWNLPFGRLFQGDAGSLFSGFLLAGLAVIAAGADGRGPVSIYLVPFALTPLLTDVLLTLLDRARRRQGLADAHRDHLYQLWLIKTGRPHGPLALRVWALTAAYAALGLWAQHHPDEPLILALGVAVAAVGWAVARRRLMAMRGPT